VSGSPLVVRHVVSAEDPKTAADLLAVLTGLPKARIKDAMAKGAVHRKQGRRPEHRLRRATAPLKPGDRVALHYDPDILSRTPPPVHLVADHGRYSIWDKSAGLLTQGTRFGDHCSLLRLAERHFSPPRPALPVHRLDREASGLILVAHDGKAAAALSALFREGRLVKEYRAEARGRMEPAGEWRKIAVPIDGKGALTEARAMEYLPGADVSRVEVRLHTGRRHQIRRHMDEIGFPVMGDPRYGRGNRNREGLRLTATGLAFTCPLTGEKREYRVAAQWEGEGDAETNG
jgi:tRNA pseudouridine32 synthase/23S rRNA pseudouridine746 synthase